MGDRFETVDVAELNDEQRRRLPGPIPDGLRVVRCTQCRRTSVESGGTGLDPWKDHDDECAPFGLTIPPDLAERSPDEITTWLDEIEHEERYTQAEVIKARQAASDALGFGA
ncbi:hypothetical protein AB0I94_21770 [Streptomyces sp. NPDC050147]|uniref:hypothetical protein n=1 Tax=Streptomyces sp. NPDC050147 TaxID=3155513 RepID=UPI00343F903C